MPSRELLETLRSYSFLGPLLHAITLFSKLFRWRQRGGGRRGDLAHIWLFSVHPVSCYLLEFQVLGGGMALLSSVGTTRGTAVPRFVLKLCGFSGCGTSDIQAVLRGIGPRCKPGFLVGAHLMHTRCALAGGHCGVLRRRFQQESRETPLHAT